MSYMLLSNQFLIGGKWVGLDWVEGIFWTNSKVRAGWINNPTQPENFQVGLSGC